MTFDRPWALLLLLLPLSWTAWELQRTNRRLALLLKTLAFIAIALAIAEPRLTISETKMAVAVLGDTSASVSPPDLGRESELATPLDKKSGPHWVILPPVA